MKTNAQISENEFDCTKFLGNFGQLFGGSKFSATINEIKNKIIELNFDREDFKINSGWASVKEALGNHNIISINGENVKLNDENISASDKTECLKICGQKIAYFHVTSSNLQN